MVRIMRLNILRECSNLIFEKAEIIKAIMLGINNKLKISKTKNNNMQVREELRNHLLYSKEAHVSFQQKLVGK